jgi:hypothetical protein
MSRNDGTRKAAEETNNSFRSLAWLLIALIVGALLLVLFWAFPELDWSTRSGFLLFGGFLVFGTIVLGYHQTAAAISSRRKYLHEVTKNNLKRVDRDCFYILYSRWNSKKPELIKKLYAPTTPFEDPDGNMHVVIQAYPMLRSQVESGYSYQAIGDFLLGNDRAMIIETDGGTMRMQGEQSVSVQFNNSPVSVSGDFVIGESSKESNSAFINAAEREAALRVIEWLDSIPELPNTELPDTKDTILLMLEPAGKASKEKRNRAADFLQTVSASVTGKLLADALGIVISRLLS